MNSAHYILNATGLSRAFNRVPLFTGLDITVKTGESFCVTGPNGSGKSTLLKILAGILSPSAGNVTYTADAVIPREEWPVHIGYTGPMVNPYDELTARENIGFASRRGCDPGRGHALLCHFGLSRHGDKKLKHYSSGMKQRLKIIIALVNDPPVLILDEPGTNLDDDGKDLLAAVLDDVRKQKIILIATNDAREEQLCGGGVRLG